MNKLFGTCSILIGISILFAAVGSHLLANKVSHYAVQVFEKGNFYLMTQSLAILVLLNITKTKPISPKLIILLFAGMVLFCASLYLIVLSELTQLTSLKSASNLAPFGGVSMILSWLFIGINFFKNK